MNYVISNRNNTNIVAAVLLYKGGLTALQTSVVICGVPFSIIVVFACRQFYKSLESELED